MMLKKILALVLALALCMSFAACDKDSNGEKSNGKNTASPEKVAEEFIRAMYFGDLDSLIDLIPTFTYDVLIEMENLEVPEGKEKKDVVYDLFAETMEQEPEELATDVQVETKISDEKTKETYFETVREYYISEGILTEEDLEEIEDAVWVAFNSDVTYQNGDTASLKDFESAIPCVKVDGRWHVDFLYLLFVPVQAEPQMETATLPAP